MKTVCYKCNEPCHPMIQLTAVRDGNCPRRNDDIRVTKRLMVFFVICTILNVSSIVMNIVNVCRGG